VIPFRVDFRPGASLYEQIVYAAKKAMISGQLRAGDAFPSGGTCDRYSSNGRQMFKTQELHRQTQRPANNPHPRFTNPTPILIFWIKRVSQVAETVLGPAVLVIVDALLKQDGVAVLIAQEKRIPFGGNCETENLSLLAKQSPLLRVCRLKQPLKEQTEFSVGTRNHFEFSSRLQPGNKPSCGP
jgi:hypothetical protein